MSSQKHSISSSSGSDKGALFLFSSMLYLFKREFCWRRVSLFSLYLCERNILLSKPQRTENVMQGVPTCFVSSVFAWSVWDWPKKMFPWLSLIRDAFTGNTIFLVTQTLVSQPYIYGALLQTDFKGLFMALIQKNT